MMMGILGQGRTRIDPDPYPDNEERVNVWCFRVCEVYEEEERINSKSNQASFRTMTGASPRGGLRERGGGKYIFLYFFVKDYCVLFF